MFPKMLLILKPQFSSEHVSNIIFSTSPKKYLPHHLPCFFSRHHIIYLGFYIKMTTTKKDCLHKNLKELISHLKHIFSIYQNH